MLLYIKRLSKRFGDSWVLRDIGLSIAQGTTTIIIGPSGSGKSTLLSCMNLLELPTEGSIRLGNRELTFSPGSQPDRAAILAYRQMTGTVFQGNYLFPHLTALENVMAGPVIVQGANKGDAAANARVLLQRMKLGSYADRYPYQLSGGQQQRVGIARAMAMEPQLLLFDEPTSALDPELVGEVLEAMKELASEGVTLVIATHEMEFARRAADRVIFVEQGEILASGSPEQVFEQSGHERVRLFLTRFTTSNKNITGGVLEHEKVKLVNH